MGAKPTELCVRRVGYEISCAGNWIIASACESDMSKKINVTESLRYKGGATFSIGGETTDGVSGYQWSCKKYFLRDGNYRCWRTSD